ncbi:MAG: hypothetical protein WDA16_03915 [Candidatus Thermoplasmatota archaeon]
MKVSLSPAEGSRLDKLPVDEFTTDKAFYAALKLHVYASVHDGFFTTLLNGRSVLLDQELKLEVGRFTARKANHLFVSENGHRASTSSEFYGFTSHKVREKLTHFHSMGVVELLGKGLRDAYTYRWRLPVKHWEVCSFEKFRRRTSEDLSMNLEIYRIFIEKGMDQFAPRDFIDIYTRAHGAEYNTTRWGARKWETIGKSFQYTEFIRGRLQRLLDKGLLLGKGDELRVNPDMSEAVNHFDLFLNAVPFRPSRAMCDACPLDSLCQAGSTQRLIVSLNQN